MAQRHVTKRKGESERVSVGLFSVAQNFSVCLYSKCFAEHYEANLMNNYLLLCRISFALDEKGKPIDSSSVKRPTVLLSKNTTAAGNSVKKHSGGPDRNNHVLMEFHLNKVSVVLFATIICHATILSANDRKCGEALRDVPK